MPSDKKRVNLTIPDDVYERIQKYKEANGIMNDASACYQLIVQQLKAFDNLELFAKVIRENSMEVLMSKTADGLSFVKENEDKLFPIKDAGSTE